MIYISEVNYDILMKKVLYQVVSVITNVNGILCFLKQKIPILTSTLPLCWQKSKNIFIK